MGSAKERRRYEAAVAKLARLPAPERKAVKRAIRRPKTRQQRKMMADAITDIVTACARTISKRGSDAKTDGRRRTLIGARLRREDVERYRAAATATGRSLYRFTADALEREVERLFDTQRQQEERMAEIEQAVDAQIERLFDCSSEDRQTPAR